MRSLGYVEKLTRSDVKILNAKEGRVLATVSTETKDRDGDIIRQAFWDTTHFIQNPVLVDSHNYASIERIIGHWESMEVKGKALVGEAVYHLDSPNAHVSELAKQGLDLAHRNMAAFSVGFIPDMSKAVELKNGDNFFPNFEFKGQELLEVSQVSVPSNPEALARMKGMHPVIDELVEKMITITIDDGPNGDGGSDDEKLFRSVVQTFMTDIGVRLDTIENELIPLVKLLHTHIGGPEPENDPGDDELEKNIKAGHGEHGHEGSGSHTHDGDKAIDFTRILRELTEEALHG